METLVFPHIACEQPNDGKVDDTKEEEEARTWT